MRSQANYLTILSSSGLVLCFVATIYVVGQYFMLSKNEVIIQALKPGSDVMTQKISEFSVDKDNMSLILGELRYRNKQITILHASLATMNSDEMARVRGEIILLSGVTVIFVILIVILRKRKKPKIKDSSAGQEE